MESTKTQQTKFSPETMVAAILQYTEKKAPKPEETMSYWIRLMAQFRGNGYSLEELNSILGLQKIPLLNQYGQKTNEPFTQELLDLAFKTHDLGLGNLKDQRATKHGYFNWANSSLFFLRFGSGINPEDKVRPIDVKKYTQAVNSSCEELFLVEPPLGEYYQTLGGILVKDICQEQLNLILTKNGKRLE